MKKINFARAHQVLSEKEMKNVLGGSGGSCPSGQFSCTCNGTNYGCVSSVQECWNKC